MTSTATGSGPVPEPAAAPAAGTHVRPDDGAAHGPVHRLGPEWAVGPDGVRFRNAARVILLDAHDRVLLLHGCDADQRERTWWFTVGGGLDAGESALDAAVRELREETGYEGGAARVLGCVELNPSWQSTPVHAVLVREVRCAGEQEEDEGEDIRVRLLPVAEVRRRVAVGEIDAAATVCALALWDWRTRELSRDG